MYSATCTSRSGRKPRAFAIAAFLAAVSVLTATSDDAFAQDERVRKKFDDKIHVVQPKPVLQKGRFELQPKFGMSLNDAINTSVMAGVSANYHILESLYVGGLFEWYDFGGTLGGESNTFEIVSTQTRTDADAAVINYMAGLELGYVPIYGKFAFLNSGIVYYDVAVTLGGAFINGESVLTPTAQNTFGGLIGINGRAFLTKWLALNVFLRDTIYMADLQGQSGALTNVVMTGLGVSFYLPTTFEYTEKVVEAEAN
jgi:outer membrane beta-barrel protein